MSVEELEQGLEYLMSTLYTADEAQRRRRVYLETVLQNRGLAS